MGNPFAETEWKTATTGDILQAGDHIVTIDSIDGTGTSSGGHPQIEVKASNDQGMVTDWMVTIPAATFRPAALFAACELEKPADNQIKEDGSGFRIDPKYLDYCIGKQVGVIVRMEPKYDDPNRMVTKVKGWCKPSEINEGDLPGDTEGLGNGSAPGTAKDDDIPFRRLPFPEHGMEFGSTHGRR